MTAPPERRHRTGGGWFWRRLMAYCMTAFAMTTITWITQSGSQDGMVNRLAVEGCLWLLGSIFMIYVAGATAQDVITLTRAARGSPEPQKDDK